MTEQKKIGLIAGYGEFPLLYIKELKSQNFYVCVCAIAEEAGESLKDCADAIAYISVGELGKLIKFFKSENVNEIIMAGKVKKTLMFKKIKPDLKAITLFLSLKDKKDDTILNAICKYLEKEGLIIVPQTKYLHSIFPEQGKLSARKPSSKELADINFGYHAAKLIAGADIGQTAVIKDSSVMALEAIEGTDETILRGGKLACGGAVVVKVNKPEQDLRFDIPAVGSGTLDAMNDSGCVCLAFEKNTIIINKQEFIKKSNDYGIAVYVI
ncbi:MAG: LpxI family protein [Candidatus Acididesulfobacter guangdongensis]|uniref:LpxI family protein n=1 Tax=Acididesulfobacter guangdongensis TaxID=2597225 RepID=A0A519BI34_ACIG2|nr:MAG: LpxI family protein [Candidatus Acididesulfobacter guangdongensis]